MSTTVVPSINLKPKPDSVLQTVLDDVMHLLPSDGVACFLLGADEGVERMAFTGLAASHVQQIAAQGQAVLPYLERALAVSEPVVLARYDSPTAVSIWAEAEQHGYKTVLCVPLFKASHEHEGLGMFMVYSQQPLSDFNAQRQNFLLGLARQLSLMLDRAHLLEAERQARIRLEALQEVQIQLGRSLDLDEVLDALLIQVRRVVPYDTANLTLFEKQTIKVIRTAGYENTPYDDILGKQLDISHMPTLLQIGREKKSLIIPDTNAYANWWQVPGLAYIQSWVGVPIIVSGEVVAVMGLDKTEANFYTPEMAHLLDSFAAQGAIALRNAQLFEAQNQQAQQLAHMHQLTRALSNIDSAQTLSQTVVEFLHEQFGFEYVAVFLYQPTRQQYDLAALSGLAWQPDVGEYVLSAADSLVSTAVDTKRIIQAAAPALDDHFVGIGNLGLQMQIAIPLWRQSYPLGVLT
ncbi:MAG: GAF domain-containing protein, partial [Anaerolineales bacterium]|nr:GAF domain-containing protein [Anaerolineales bacterium]